MTVKRICTLALEVVPAAEYCLEAATDHGVSLVGDAMSDARGRDGARSPPKSVCGRCWPCNFRASAGEGRRGLRSDNISRPSKRQHLMHEIGCILPE